MVVAVAGNIEIHAVQMQQGEIGKTFMRLNT